jgi:uncharacterized membrane protein
MRLRYMAIALVSVAYIVGSQWLMTSAPESAWSVVALLSPMLVAVAIGAWRAGQRMLSLGSAGLALALCASAALGVHVSAQLLYVAQHVGINGFLAVWFGSTLRVGAQPLISRLAARVHRLTPAKVIYTRHVTLAWALFFVAIVMVSVLLYAFASFEAWAFYANVGTPIAVGAMFAIEYLLRYRLHPEFERTTLSQAIRSYMQGNDDSALEETHGRPKFPLPPRGADDVCRRPGGALTEPAKHGPVR